MGIQQQSMKVHQLTRGLWNNNQHEPTSLTLGCKRLRPLAPKINSSSDTTANSSFDLKSFIRPDNGQRKPGSSSSSSVCQKKDEPPSQQQQVESQQAAGGTRWNPTQEQIGILEMLYKCGMRTPNAQQIEQITAQLGKYGKIEGKNVFYWFQNHKARERQKQKRSGNNNLGLCKHMSGNTTHRTLTSSVDCSSGISATALSLSSIIKGEELEGTKMTTTYKRKCSAWAFDQCIEEEEEDEGEDRTLELFPLKPELGR